MYKLVTILSPVKSVFHSTFARVQCEDLCCTERPSHMSWVRVQVSGRRWAALPLEAVPDPRESPSEKHLNEDLRVNQNYPYIGWHWPTSTSQMRVSYCQSLNDHSYPKSEIVFCMCLHVTLVKFWHTLSYADSQHPVPYIPTHPQSVYSLSYIPHPYIRAPHPSPLCTFDSRPPLISLLSQSWLWTRSKICFDASLRQIVASAPIGRLSSETIYAAWFFKILHRMSPATNCEGATICGATNVIILAKFLTWPVW